MSKKERNKRELYLFEEIDSKTVKPIIERIKELEKNRKKTPIHLFVNSPGGDVGSGFALIDVITNCKCPVYTYAMGEICSMAPAIFVAGKRRFISKHTFVMLHPVSCGVDDYVNFAKSRILNAEAAEKMYDDWMLSRTKMTKEFYNHAKTNELWIAAEEALKYKIADAYYGGK